MNARYQKYQEPQGKTRKSAAALKPSRKGTGPKSTPAKSSSSRSTVRIEPATPEYKRMRTYWWAALIVGVVLVAVSWALRQYLGGQRWAVTVSLVALAVSYACIFLALYIDWTRLRPMREAAVKAAKSGKAPKAEKAEKAAKPAKSDADSDDE